MNQKGFTLVELAIVLVIIGVILGGVIKGQELVTNARMKGLYREYQQVEFAYYSYLDRYNGKPGDDNRATTNVTVATGGTLDDGVIEGNWDSTTATDENNVFWAHVRDAGFFTDGAATLTDLPTNTFGSNISVTTVLTNGSIMGFNANDDLTCFSAIEGDIASAFDAQFDDGDATTGLIQGALLTAINTEAAYVQGTDSVICILIN